MAARKPASQPMAVVAETFAVLGTSKVYRRGTIMPASDPVVKKHARYFAAVEDAAKPSAPQVDRTPVDPEIEAEG